MNIVALEIDLGKNICSVVGLGAAGQVFEARQLLSANTVHSGSQRSTSEAPNLAQARLWSLVGSRVAEVCETERTNGGTVPPTLLKPGSTPWPFLRPRVIEDRSGRIVMARGRQLQIEAG
jgi:hypothetical protein